MVSCHGINEVRNSSVSMFRWAMDFFKKDSMKSSIEPFGGILLSTLKRVGSPLELHLTLGIERYQDSTHLNRPSK